MISEEQRGAIDRKHAPLPVKGDVGPWPDLLEVWSGWWELGLPATVAGGGMMAVGVQDLRHALYSPRRAWLEEHGIVGRVRSLYLHCWAELDGAYIAHLHKLVEH